MFSKLSVIGLLLGTTISHNLIKEEIDIQIPTLDDEHFLTKEEYLKNLKHKDPDMDRSFTQIVAENKMDMEIHPVVTADGYILDVYRIKDPVNTKPGAPVVFLQHGITDSSDTWIMHYPEKAIAF